MTPHHPSPPASAPPSPAAPDPQGLERIIASLASRPEPLLQAAAWGLRRFGYRRPVVAPYRVTWDLTSRCNLRCLHCSGRAGRAHPRELSFTQVKELVRRLRAFGIKRASFTGGEIFLRPDLFDVLKLAREAGLEVSVATNATLVTDAAAARLKALGVRSVQTSLDGPEAAVHNWLRGRPWAFERTCRGIRVLLRHGLPVIATMTVTRANWRSVPQTIDLAVELGLPAFSINDLIFTGRGEQLRDQAVDDEAYDSLVALFERKKRELSGRIRLAWEGAGGAEASRPPDRERAVVTSRCLAALTRFHIGPDGTVHPCNLIHLPAGNLLTQPVEEVFESPVFRAFRDREALKGRCGGCDYRFSCGGCRSRAYAYFGDIHAPDPRCRGPGARREASAP
ncbi:MAG: radical SAM protein [Acetobacteraceae bacterium]|nr:radical SAM protein [Acetobacteraceae bacterium]